MKAYRINLLHPNGAETSSFSAGNRILLYAEGQITTDPFKSPGIMVIKDLREIEDFFGMCTTNFANPNSKYILREVEIMGKCKEAKDSESVFNCHFVKAVKTGKMIRVKDVNNWKSY